MADIGDYHHKGLKSLKDSRCFPCAPVRVFIGFMTSFLFLLFLWQCLIRNPEFPEIQMESATIVGLNLSPSSGLSGIWDINLVITNPNQKVSVSCHTVKVSLFRDYLPPLATNQVPSFFVDSMNHTLVNFQFGLVNRYIADHEPDKISEEITTRGSVTFGVLLQLHFTHRTKVLDRWDAQNSGVLRYFCDPIEFRFSSNNVTGPTFIGQSTKCPVE